MKLNLDIIIKDNLLTKLEEKKLRSLILFLIYLKSSF